MKTLWRVEGSGVDPELTEGLAARVADPLWYLARQWQVGEFRGEDAASPVLVEAEIDVYQVTESLVIEGKNVSFTPYDPEARPLQAQIEAETSDESLSLKDHLLAARRFCDLLLAEGFDEEHCVGLGKLYGLLPSALRDKGDPVGVARLAVLARGAFDPRRLLQAVAAAGEIGKLEVFDGLSADEYTRLRDLYDRWLVEQGRFAHVRDDKAPAAWVERRQEYRFGVVAKLGDEADVRLAAPEYTGGALDWHHFDLVGTAKKFPKRDRHSLRMLASPLRFAGQPAARFWEIEEGEVYFGDLAGGAGDLSRSILAAYAAVSGDDWFVLPARLPTGHLSRVARMRVRDTFDDWTDIAPIARVDADEERDRVWRWFEHRDRTGVKESKRPLLYLPQNLPETVRGPVIEEVRFRRDEMANLAWAIERKYPGPYGRAVVPERVRRQETPVPEISGDWTYELGHEVPDHWFPLVPIRTTGSGAEILLRRGRVAHDPKAQKSPRAKGVLLTPGKPFLLEEAEVPHGGAEVTRRWILARTADGGRHLWVGRRKRPSVGAMGQSPLVYDELSGWSEAPKRT